MIDSPETPKKKRGWPAGKPRKPRDQEAKVNPRAAATAKYEFNDDDDDDRLKIANELIPDGMSYQWVCDSILGQPQPQRRARFERKGWSPVPAERHDGMFTPKGYKGEINVDGLVLMERPLELTIRAQQKDKMRAREQVHVREAQLRGGDLGGRVGFDTQHESALRSNRINKSFERVPVPEE